MASCNPKLFEVEATETDDGVVVEDGTRASEACRRRHLDEHGKLVNCVLSLPLCRCRRMKLERAWSISRGLCRAESPLSSSLLHYRPLSLSQQMASHNEQRLVNRLSSISHILLVLSGKGGVGKSSVSVQLALSLLANNPAARVGLLDVDLTGPSLPRMLGLQGQDVHASADGWVPVYLDARGPSGKGGVLACMSIGFLLKNSSESVVWRGPKKNAMIKQFLGEVRWGALDYLIVDTPPGEI